MSTDPQPVRLATEGTTTDPEVVLVHATGFCKEVWRPVTDAFDKQRPGTSTLAVDLRGHGDSPAPGPPYRWDVMTDDVVLTTEHTVGAIGVGHSCGGAIVARAAAQHPALFSKLILIEPIILPPPYLRMNIPLARAAQRRKNFFPSRDAAYERFRSGPMADWTEAALDAYVDHGFAPGDGGVLIKCDPAVEADVFREGNNHDTWDLVADIDVPVTIVSGERSETHTAVFLDMLEQQFKAPRMVSVADTGHFLPMERPDVVAGLVAEALAGA